MSECHEYDGTNGQWLVYLEGQVLELPGGPRGGAGPFCAVCGAELCAVSDDQLIGEAVPRWPGKTADDVRRKVDRMERSGAIDLSVRSYLKALRWTLEPRPTKPVTKKDE